MIVNLKREIEILHENAQEMDESVKRLKANSEGYQWELKQVQIERVN
jgi:prefoldin subunit 5